MMRFAEAAARSLAPNSATSRSAPVPSNSSSACRTTRSCWRNSQDYWNKDNVFLDKVTYLPIPDSAVRLANLRSGDLDMVERLAPSDVAAVKADSNLTVSDIVGLGYMSMYVNVGNGPRADNPLGKDKRLRQAFSLAIDRDAIMPDGLRRNGCPGQPALRAEQPMVRQGDPGRAARTSKRPRRC